MQAFIANTFSDEEGPMAVEGKVVIVHGSRTEVLALARFFGEVAQHLENSAYCHMHLRDRMPGWSKAEHVDFEITVDERPA